jgi:Leucine-rich repeat (LRR) protein
MSVFCSGVVCVCSSLTAPPLHSLTNTQVVPKAVDGALLASGLSQIARSGNGLEHAYVRLDLKGKELTDVSEIAKCVHLRMVDLSKNLLTDISAANTIPELCSLNVSNNKLTGSSLEPRPYLQIADFSNNQIAETTNGFAHPMLRTCLLLFVCLLHSTKVGGRITLFPSCPLLIRPILLFLSYGTAWLSYRPPLSPSPLATLAGKLNLDGNKLSTLEGLSKTQLPAVEYLELRENAFTGLGSIQLATLTHLFIDGNQLTTLEGIGVLTSLVSLSAKKNQIKALDGFTAAQTALTTLDLGENSLTVLAECQKLSALPALSSVTLAENACAEDPTYRSEILIYIVSLTKLDDEPFEEEERVEASTEREKRAADALEAAAAEDEEEGGGDEAAAQ